MRTNIDLDDDLVQEARRLTGIATKKALVEEALRVLIASRRRRSLLDLEGRVSFADGYDYKEHRVLLGARWSLNLNPFAPREVSPEGHVPLPYGIEDGGDGFDEDRIQDLLRQDEAARAGSACVD